MKKNVKLLIYTFSMIIILSCKGNIINQENNIVSKDSLFYVFENEKINLEEFFGLNLSLDSLKNTSPEIKITFEKKKVKYGDNTYKLDTICILKYKNSVLRYYISYGKKTIIDSKIVDYTFKLKDNSIYVGMKKKQFLDVLPELSKANYKYYSITDISGFIEFAFKFNNNDVLEFITIVNVEGDN